jgi:predicted  nucleic acid-binding Zn-ribbon protein
MQNQVLTLTKQNKTAQFELGESQKMLQMERDKFKSSESSLNQTLTDVLAKVKKLEDENSALLEDELRIAKVPEGSVAVKQSELEDTAN